MCSKRKVSEKTQDPVANRRAVFSLADPDTFSRSNV
jgi:hypothetical protein